MHDYSAGVAVTTTVVLSGADVAEVIARDMQNLPEELRKETRLELREAGGAVMRDAKVRSSWSGRIPATISLHTSFRFDREGVLIVAGGNAAPHARLYEGIAGHAFFRHPVFKTPKRRKTAWVSQETRPFLFPAARAHEAETNAAMLAVLDKAARAIGFGG